MNYKNNNIVKHVTPIALIAYLVAASIPGLFNLQPGTSKFIIYQVACFVVLWLYVLANIARHRARVLMSGPGFRFLIMYLGLMSASLVYVLFAAVQSGDSFLGMAQFFLPIALAATLIIGFGKTAITVLDFDRFIRLTLMLLVACSIYNIVVNLDGIMSLTSITGSYQVNFKGFFFNRNVFGYMMAMGIACTSYLWYKERKKLYILYALIIGVSLLAAMSRGAFVFLAIFLLLFALQVTRSKTKLALGIIILVVPILLFVSSQPFVQDNLIRADVGTAGRSDLQSAGVRNYLNGNLIFGGGQESIVALEHEFGASSYHNLYIEMLTTQGIIGVATILLLVGYIRVNLKLVKKSYKVTGSFLVAALIAYLVYSLFESLPLFYATPNSVLTTYILIMFPLFMVNGITTEERGA